jgi:hypothetical protein
MIEPTRCFTCGSPLRDELTWCRRCHAAIDCLCCDCDGPAVPADEDETNE